MKKSQTIIVIGMLVFGLALSGAAFAMGPQNGIHKAGHHRGAAGQGVLAKYVRQNMKVQALAEITGQPAESVRQQLRDGGTRAFMNEHKIDRAAFRAAMQEKTKALVADLVKNGYITPEQQERMAERAQLRAERHALMGRLVEKGIADGTITQEQARLLMGRHF